MSAYPINSFSSLSLIPFVSPTKSEEIKSEKQIGTSSSSILNGKEVYEFYNEVISTPSQKPTEPPIYKQTKSIPAKKPVESSDLKLNKSSIFRFSQDGDVDKIRLCLNNGFPIDQQDSYGWTAIMCAACEGHVDVVKLLIKLGANLDLKCKQGMTAKDIALKTKNNAIVKILQDGYLNSEEDSLQISNFEETLKYCTSCKASYTLSTSDHERSIAHLLSCNNSTDSTFYHIPENNKGFQMMLRKGWDKNKGLGPNADGRKFPIKTVLKQDRSCIGKSKEVPKVTHFNAKDVSSIQLNKPSTMRTVREKTLKKWQMKKLSEISRRKEIEFRRQFHCDY